ncbi:hypothetical protein BDQ12DRAFT_731612 [Crucibulum laeve]|uniref:DUF7719 domain-containing protein n=1 Tax=Crucibulum laeve TaxID=68775 RepID=A0A5C3MFC3_9AGAR|nr:hypothetical protein BDQ12DRAFT_731612 [Crucibulum laeve]
MTRQHKAKPSNSSSLPTKPVPEKPLVEIPEDEKWRLINQSGVLNSINPKTSAVVRGQDVEEEPTPLGDEIFNTVLLLIPFSSLLLLMEILIHQQYGKRPSLQAIIDRMAPGVPILSLFIFYTTRYKQHRSMQFLLFILSVFAGSRMIYLVNLGSWLMNMRQCPPLATIWIYTIVQLELSPAVVSLLTTASFVWWKGLKLKL